DRLGRAHLADDTKRGEIGVGFAECLLQRLTRPGALLADDQGLALEVGERDRLASRPGVLGRENHYELVRHQLAGDERAEIRSRADDAHPGPTVLAPRAHLATIADQQRDRDLRVLPPRSEEHTSELQSRGPL